MDYPGLDPKKLTDEQLVNKISDVRGRLLFFYGSGATAQIMDQFNAILETLEFEQYVRMSKKAMDIELKSSGVQVETELDLVEKKESTVEQKKDKKGVSPGSIFKRTPKPSNDGPGES